MIQNFDFLLGYMDCAKLSINFIDSLESSNNKKQQIIEHISKECAKTIQSSYPPLSFNQQHEIAFAKAGVSEHLNPFHMMSLGGESEWPSIDEKLGFSPIAKFDIFATKYNQFSGLMSSSSFLKIEEPQTDSAFNLVGKTTDSSFNSPSTSGTSVTVDETPQRSISVCDETSDEDDDVKLIIEDPNNNQTWRPWI